MWRESILYGFAHLLRHALPALIVAGVMRGRTRRHPSSDLPGILVTRFDGMGDFILLSPFLRELRRNYPTSTITLLVGRNVVQLAAECPYVNKVLVLDPGPQKEMFASYRRYLLAFARYLKYLVAFADLNLIGRVDLAIQPRWDVDLDWATLITFLSGAPRRIGYSEKASPMKSWCNFCHDHLFTDVLPPGAGRHEVERNLDIVRYLGGSVESAAPEVWWGPEDDLAANRFLSECRVSEACQLVAFGIGAKKERRRWPFYGQLIRLLARDLEFTPLLLVGPGEEESVREIRAVAPRVAVMTLSLRAAASVLSRCALFIGNNSGPMHLASAVGLPVIELSCHPVNGHPGHENSPDRFGPVAAQWKSIRPEAPLGNCKTGCLERVPHCITGISPERVASEVVRFVESLKCRTYE